MCTTHRARTASRIQRAHDKALKASAQCPLDIAAQSSALRRRGPWLSPLSLSHSISSRPPLRLGSLWASMDEQVRKPNWAVRSPAQPQAKPQAAVVTVTPMGKEKWSRGKSVLCVHQDGSDGCRRRRRAVYRALGEARVETRGDGVRTSMTSAWQPEMVHTERERASEQQDKKGTTRVRIWSKYQVNT